MRGYGSLNPLDGVGLPPDTVGTVVVSSAGAIVAQDWPSDAGVVQFGSTMGFFINNLSTQVNIPTTNQEGSTSSSDLNEYVSHGHRQQIPGGSTGYSVASPTSGVITMSFWNKL